MRSFRGERHESGKVAAKPLKRLRIIPPAQDTLLKQVVIKQNVRSATTKSVRAFSLPPRTRSGGRVGERTLRIETSRIEALNRSRRCESALIFPGKIASRLTSAATAIVLLRFATVQSICFAFLLLTRWSCFAESPVITHMLPGAIAPGRVTEVIFFGSHLGGATNLWMSFDGTTQNIRCSEDRAVFKICVPASCSTGLGAVRLAATNGVSNLHLVMMDGLANLRASGTNHSLANAQALRPTIAVDGVCSEKASDFFKFTARRGERLSFEVVAQRLGSTLDPLVRLLDEQGRELVFCEDTPGAGVDCRFSYKFLRKGSYFLELRDTRYEGGSNYRYRLRFGDFPLATEPLPFHVKSEFAPPLSLLPQITEVEPNDSEPQQISVPACIHGRFSTDKDRDCFQFEAEKGERLAFRGRTRSFGSPCDLYLRLQTGDGKKIAEFPLVGADEGSLTNTFTETGAYRLVIEEAAQLAGPEFFYRVEIERDRPGFTLSVETDKVQAPSGGSVEVKVAPQRHGYDGPITLDLQAGGDGFELEKNVLTSKTNTIALTIKAPANVEPGQLLHFKISGHGMIEGKDFSAVASTQPALRKLFPHLPWPPAELDGWIALGVISK